MSKLRLGLEWFLNPDHVPLLVGLEQGWFADVGLDLELVEPSEHVDAIAELQAGTLDIAVTEPVHLVEDRGKGHAVVGWARFLHTNGGVMYFTGRGIERPKDMVGKRLQYPGAPSALGRAIAKTMIEADGGDFTEDAITSVDNGFLHTDALVEDKADLATLVFYNFEVIEARQSGYDAQFFALKDWGVPDFCQLILIATPELLQQRRQDLQTFLKVLRRGIDFIHQHPQAAQAIYDQRTGAYAGDQTGQAIYDATISCFTHDFSMSADYYDRLQAWMHNTGQIPQCLSANDYWTNALAL
ncbi:ABC transporter substrate-binding protein [Leptolyngbyaceae cyanobacterium CCMR0082]|uniref:Thiamine pyrimidine synthase n=1 Tax=Adonisia turfae CCMR0082 TaxID=2304604 RepID=A0A6M0SIG6_9CYAN|nr:ABC transporter substrate-binding protein [Adonisia turfae]NEZ68245.1 ABC transporter substrate-binding protein [Adonisia turfae CCMR0082]